MPGVTQERKKLAAIMTYDRQNVSHEFKISLTSF